MKKIFKKTISLLVAATFLMSTGCAKEVPIHPKYLLSDQEEQQFIIEEGASLVYWSENDAFATAVATAFTEKYDVPVKVQTVGFDSVSKLMLEGPAGNAADVVWGKITDMPNLVNSGVIMPYHSQVVENVTPMLQEVSLTASTIDNKLYAVPMSLETNALYYNKDVITSVPNTLDEILEDSLDFNNSATNDFYFLVLLTMYNLQPVFSAFDLELFGENGTDNDNANLDSDAMVQSLRYIKSLKDAMPIPSADIQIQSSDFVLQNFIAGKTPFMINGSWAIKNFKEQGVNFGVVPIPSINGTNPKPYLGITANFISSNSKYPMAAQAFAEFMSSAEAAQVIYDNSGQLPALKDISSINGLLDDDVSKGFIEQFEFTSIQPTVPRMTYIWDIVVNVVNAVFDGNLTPEDGAVKMQKDFDALVLSE